MKHFLAGVVFVIGFFVGRWAGSIDWNEWLKQMQSGRSTSIGNQMAYEKISLKEAYDHDFENSQRGYYTGWHDCEEKVGHKIPHPPIAYTLDEAKRMAGYE